MVQLSFLHNRAMLGSNRMGVSNGTISFVPFAVYDSISLLSMNFLGRNSNSSATYTFSVGLYTLTGSSLSIMNSLSGSFPINSTVSATWLSLTATSATQNMTPGNYWFGFLISTANHSSFSISGQTSLNPGNAFPGGFIGGRMTASTNALPSSYATSDLDTTGNDALFVPHILLTA